MDNVFDEKNKVQPISPIDKEIIIIIKDVLDQVGFHDLRKVLEGYKGNESDTSVLDKLSELSSTIESSDESDSNQQIGGSKAPPREYINIGGDNDFRVFALFRIQSAKRWDDDLEDYVYGIIINPEPLPKSAEWYTNTWIPFLSEESRDDELRRVKSVLEQKNCVFL